MIFATDLDRTLIFSYKFLSETNNDYVCVEEKNNKNLSYMSQEALDLLTQLKEENDLYIVPITTRSISQFERIKVLQDCEYAIVSNGAYILHNGKIFKPWYDKIYNDLIQIKDEYIKIEELLKGIEDKCIEKPRIVDGAFYFMKLPNDREIINDVLEFCEENLKALNWNYTLQGLKLYVIPKVISKERALKYLMNLLSVKKVITAGDGKLDIGFVSIGDYRIIPEKSEILDYLPNVSFEYFTVPFGLDGTYTLLNNVFKFKNSKI